MLGEFRIVPIVLYVLVCKLYAINNNYQPLLFSVHFISYFKWFLPPTSLISLVYNCTMINLYFHYYEVILQLH